MVDEAETYIMSAVRKSFFFSKNDRKGADQTREKTSMDLLSATLKFYSEIYSQLLRIEFK